ncbi:hypothetical protein ACFLTH_04805 [Bacteroidota bacterium]
MINISNKIQYFLKSDINELFITNALRSFALSTIAVFIPIFFLQKGYSLWEVILYFLIQSTIGIFLDYGASKFCAKKGLKHSIMMSIPFMILFFLMLYNIDFLTHWFGRIGILVFLTLISKTSTALFFIGFHIDFAKFSHRDQSAKEISLIQALGIISSIIGPFFGAIMITYFSFNVLFIIVILVLILSIVPQFFSSEVHEPFEFKLGKIFRKEERGHSGVYFAEGFRDYAARIFWPILMFFLLINITGIGGIYTISSAILAIFTIYIGRKIHAHNKKKILRIGAIIHTFTLAIRTLLKTVSIIAVVQGFGALSFSMIQVPFQSMFYNNSKTKGIAYSVYARELYLSLGRIAVVLLLMALLLFFEPILSLIITIIVGALFTLLMTKIKEL